MKPPDEYFFVSGHLAAIECGAVCRLVHSITGDTAVDPGVFTYPIVYTNAVTGEASRFNLDRLPLGPKRLLPGHFYFSPHPLMYWYCANVVGSEMTLHLVERSEEHTSELQSLMRISYAVFCLKTKNKYYKPELPNP